MGIDITVLPGGTGSSAISYSVSYAVMISLRLLADMKAVLDVSGHFTLVYTCAL